MKNILYTYLCIIVTSVIISCQSTNHCNIYRFAPFIDWDCDNYSFLENMNELAKIHEDKSVILKNDSLFQYTRRYGGLASVVTAKYICINNEIIVDSIDIHGQYIVDSLNRYFLYSRDSLVNKKTNEKYYNEKCKCNIKREK